jgi:hypothetical protein
LTAVRNRSAFRLTLEGQGHAVAEGDPLLEIESGMSDIVGQLLHNIISSSKMRILRLLVSYATTAHYLENYESWESRRILQRKNELFSKVNWMSFCNFDFSSSSEGFLPVFVVKSCPKYRIILF